MKSHSFEELIDKYVLIKPNHTYYRTLTIDKFLAGFGVGYLLLREVYTNPPLFLYKKNYF